MLKPWLHAACASKHATVRLQPDMSACHADTHAHAPTHARAHAYTRMQMGRQHPGCPL